ncbi:hypothetical protein [Streptomyces virginiae]|uniref:hypothetical protein n=1 Tax=Streptomyces virginiae TaxID=1961 RepID=UPI003647C80D
MKGIIRFIRTRTSTVLWATWAAFFVVYETITLLNKRDDDTLSENTRHLFRTRTSKAGRAVFTAAVAGGAVWFLLHILTETM